MKSEHYATAKAQNLPISTKHSIEISSYLRYRSTKYAKRYLEDVASKKKAIPFRKFNRDMGHKSGMAAGRFPVKAAQQFLTLIKSAEANAQVKGLNTSSLKIMKLVANKASVPVTGGRQRQGTKRTHLEIMVGEVAKSKKKAEEKPALEKKAKPQVEKKAEANVDKPETKPVEKKPEVKDEKPATQPVEKPEQEKSPEKKEEPKVEKAEKPEPKAEDKQSEVKQ